MQKTPFLRKNNDALATADAISGRTDMLIKRTGCLPVSENQDPCAVYLHPLFEHIAARELHH
jgi:hypothetical protein